MGPSAKCMYVRRMHCMFGVGMPTCAHVLSSLPRSSVFCSRPSALDPSSILRLILLDSFAFSRPPAPLPAVPFPPPPDFDGMACVPWENMTHIGVD